MKKLLTTTFAMLTGLFLFSCSNEEITEPVVSNTATDMEILSRFVDVNESTGEYFINENKKTRALSYVTGSDWKDLEKVSPLSIEKYKQELQALNAQVAEAIADPNVAYMVYSTGSKTFVRKVKENVDFDFDRSEYAALGTRAPLPTLSINGGSQSTTGSFKDASRTINMEVRLNASIQFNYYFFEVLSPNAKPDYDDNITTPESVAFSGTGPLSNTRFVWTAYWDAQDQNDKMFKWEFKGKGNGQGALSGQGRFHPRQPQGSVFKNQEQQLGLHYPDTRPV